MKKTIVFLFAFGLAVASKAQNYPLAKDRTTWQYIYTTISSYACIYNIVDGDTTVNGRIYKKLYSCSTRKYDRKKASFEDAFREEGDRIYALPNQFTSQYLPVENGEVLLYDFSLQEGETFPKTNVEKGYFKVDKVDYVEIDGKQRKRIWFSDDDQDVWIEGIGSLNRPFAYPLSPTPTNGAAYKQEMFEQDGKVLYGSLRFNLLADGVHWTERTSIHGDVDESGKENFELQHFSVSGDSVINGVTYKKVYVNGYPYMNLREDENGNIWYYNEKLSKDGMLYNFESKSFYQDGMHYTDHTGKDCIIVKSQEYVPNTMELLGHCYLYFLMKESSYHQQKYPRSEQVYLIHGVGLTQGIFQHILTGDLNCICYNDLIAMYNEKNELVYQNPDFKEDGEFTSGITSVGAGRMLTVTTQNRKTTFSLIGISAGQHPTLSVYGADGSRMFSRMMDTETITVSLPAGTYVYRLYPSDTNPETGKFITGN